MGPIDISHRAHASSTPYAGSLANAPRVNDQRVNDPRANGFDHPLPANVNPTERLLSKVGGTALLLAGLKRGRLTGTLLSLAGSALIFRGMTGHCHLYDALGIDTREHNPATAIPAGAGVKLEREVIIHRDARDLYSFWRNLENLPRVMRHLERVEVIDQKRSRWIAKGPLGHEVQWDAEIINEREPELIAWRSLAGSEMDTAGSIHFHPLEETHGTRVTISLRYNPPGGKLGATVASWLGSGFEEQLDRDLAEFKRAMEGASATH
jgi:uncharacterized membrane protein